jgi:voltage-gated potassium channel
MFKKIANDGRILLTLYLATLAVGTLGMVVFEKAGLVDSFYWASTTITSTGYGDIAPKTPEGRLFAVLFQQFGIVIVLALTIAWVLGKVNADLFSHEEQVDADEDRETIKAEIRALREELAGK